MIAAELRQELDKLNFVSVIIDASIRDEVKIVLVVVRYTAWCRCEIELLELKRFPVKLLQCGKNSYIL